MGFRLFVVAVTFGLQPVMAGAATPPVPLGGPKPACVAEGVGLVISAQGNKFDRACLAVHSDQPFTISFENKDPVDHNVAILGHHAAEATMFRGELITGPRTVTYQVASLPVGVYHFHCEVHASAMKGIFAVTGADGTVMGGMADMHSDVNREADGQPAMAESMAPSGAAPAADDEVMGLARTGAHSGRILLLLAGLALALGGLTIAGGARRA